MTAQVPLGRVPTLYAKTGDLFAWLCVAGLVVILGVAASVPAKHSIQLCRARQPTAAGLAK
jgi:hypothetical protein